MTGRAHILRRLRRLRRDEDGATMVEFAIVAPIFLLLAFGIIDFGRLAMTYVATQKATEQAVRQAVVRTPVCAGLPELNLRGTSTTNQRFGSSCQIEPGTCADAGEVSCTADASAVGSDIFTSIQALLPVNATPQNLEFTYAFDPNLGFLGGPYVPRVTVDLVDLDFDFVTPLGALIALAAGMQSDAGESFAFPSMSTSLPAEVLLDGGST